jgi:hypothetical protein
MPAEKEEKKDFVVKDRRIFAEENLDDGEKEEKETPAAEEKKKQMKRLTPETRNRPFSFPK